MERVLTPAALAEQSISKKYHKVIWSRFIKAVKDYELIREGDRIAVCMSGGKDSALLAKLMQMLKRHSDYPFELVFLTMDPGYSPANREKLEKNAELLEIPLTIFETEIFDAVKNIEKSPCYLCARMRRGYLYNQARELGCNKIALGHHFSDVIETTVMGMFYGAQLQGMMPKLHSTNFEGMELIRPLYLIREDDIISWKNYNKLEFLQCACRFTEMNHLLGDGTGDSKRLEVRALIKKLKKDNPDIESNIFNSIHAVHLDTFPGYKTGGVKHSFLEKYYEK